MPIHRPPIPSPEPEPSSETERPQSDALRARMLAVQHRRAIMALAAHTLAYREFNAAKYARLHSGDAQ